MTLRSTWEGRRGGLDRDHEAKVARAWPARIFLLHIAFRFAQADTLPSARLAPLCLAPTDVFG
jgi:hypothetical protein